MVVQSLYLHNQNTMTTIDKDIIDIDNKCNENDMEPENCNSLDSGGGVGDNSNRLHRFDMVLQHLHRLKTQINNNNGMQSPAVSSAASEPTLSESPNSPAKNKTHAEDKKDDGDEKSLPNSEEYVADDMVSEEMKNSLGIEHNLQKAMPSSTPLRPPIPPAFRELHKLQALKLLQQQNQYRGNYQGKERDRKQLPHQRYPQHFGGPLSHHPSHRHSPPLPLKLPPPMRHPFFNHNHHQPINQPNNHFYPNSHNTIRNFPQPGGFSPPLSQRLSGQNNGPTSQTFPPVHLGNSPPNYPMPPPPLTRFPMPPSLMRALAPNLANLAPHMIQPLLEEAKSRLAMMQARITSDSSQPLPALPIPGSVSRSPSSPTPHNYQPNNKLPPLFPPIMKDFSMEWGNPMLSSATGFKSPIAPESQETPTEGCSYSLDKHKDIKSKKESSFSGRNEKDLKTQLDLVSDFTGLDESFLASSTDERLDFPVEEDDDEEIFLEEDVGVDDDDDDEEEVHELGVDIDHVHGVNDNILKGAGTASQNVSWSKQKLISDANLNCNSTNSRNIIQENGDVKSDRRKRKHASGNEDDAVTDTKIGNGDNNCKTVKTLEEEKEKRDHAKLHGSEYSTDNSRKDQINSKRMRRGSVSPSPSTGGISPRFLESPGTPPLPPEARMFPPPFAYKLLEVRHYF